MEPVAPLVANPPVFAVTIPAPNAKVKLVLLVPERTEVPISIIAPLATENWMAQVEVLACDVICAPVAIFIVCVVVPVKLKLTVEPDCVVV